jgi:hypothetical protein
MSSSEYAASRLTISLLEYATPGLAAHSATPSRIVVRDTPPGMSLLENAASCSAMSSLHGLNRVVAGGSLRHDDVDGRGMLDSRMARTSPKSPLVKTRP